MKFQEPSASIYKQICAYKNLELAFTRAKKRKSRKPYTKTYIEIEFTGYNNNKCSYLRNTIIHRDLPKLIKELDITSDWEKLTIYDQDCFDTKDGTLTGWKKNEEFHYSGLVKTIAAIEKELPNSNLLRMMDNEDADTIIITESGKIHYINEAWNKEHQQDITVHPKKINLEEINKRATRELPRELYDNIFYLNSS